MSDLPLSRRGVILAVTIAALGAIIAVSLALYNAPENEESPAAQTPETTSVPADAEEIVGLLPHAPEDLAQAGQVAVEFTELYASVSDAETLDAYYETLHSYTTSDYADRLQPRAGVVSAREGLLEEGITISAIASVQSVRTLVDEQVTFIIDCTMTANTDQGQEQQEEEFALTLVPGSDGDWQVHDLHIAGEGQSGDIPESMPGA